MCNPKKPTKVFTAYAMPGDTFKVKTIFEKPVKQINLSDLDSSDIASLKTKDPFMYYSIPGVRIASMLDKEIDWSTFDVSAPSSDHRNKKQKMTGSGPKEACIVVRKSQVSYECHPGIFDQEPANDEPLTSKADD
jgi:hypothetical protein